MKPAPFEYVRPSTLDEAIAFLADHGPDAKVIAGGQSLVPMLNLRLARVRYLVDIGRLTELGGIERTSDGGLRLGALVRHRETERSAEIREVAPLLSEAAVHIGHPAIRNRGTLGGSLAHADPAAELPAAVVALDATIVVRGPDGERRIPAQEFFVTIFTTALGPGELVTAVEVPPAPPGSGWAFMEVARRHGDFALVGVGAGLQVEDGRCRMARIAFTGVGDVPVRGTVVEEALTGEVLTRERIREAARRIREVLEPPSDLHASGEYRREVAAVLAERALLQAWERAAGGVLPA